MSDKNFWVDEKEETDNLKLGSSYPPVKIFISAIEIAKLNSLDGMFKTVILSDGKELDLEIYLETDRDVYAQQLKEVINEQK